MQEIVLQLGELLLQAVPTILIVLAFYLIMRALFFKPLLAVMAEREARTAGARKAAEAAEAAAAEKIKQYQEALKKARAKVYAEQEAARKKLLEERAGLQAFFRCCRDFGSGSFERACGGRGRQCRDGTSQRILQVD